MSRPFGYFVHHQGRGHAERFAAIAHALPHERPVVAFCARRDIFPDLPPNVAVRSIPSLFEKRGDEAPGMADLETPDTLHCAPVGWPGIRQAMGEMARWFAASDPALMICDVSAEVAQLARICSVPHVKILQHGRRGDPGHQAAYEGAVGVLAPFSEQLAQADWSPRLLRKTHFAAGLGVSIKTPDRASAREALNIADDRQVILVLAGGGGSGFGQAPIGVGARAIPDAQWITIGPIERDWHATEPGNLEHRGWVDEPEVFIAAADLVIASTGNTTTQMILAAGRPWLAVPEWRYFDEQRCKAAALKAAGLAATRSHLPASAADWRAAVDEAVKAHRPEAQRSAVSADAAASTARWLEALSDRLWRNAPDLPEPKAFHHG